MASYVSTFRGNGSEVHFTAGFPVLRLTDLAVVVGDAWLTLGTDYSVSGSTDSALATLAVAPANGAVVTLRSAVGYTPTDPAAVTTAAPTLHNTDTALWEALGVQIHQEYLGRAAADAAIIASGVEPANVGIAPVVATNSTASRTVADRFADLVNVKDFGAVGNGIADDSAAIQDAIDLAGSGTHGGVVWFPPGKYNIQSPLNVEQGNVELRSFNHKGLGYGASIQADATSMAYMLKVGKAGGAIYGPRIRGLQFTYTANAVVKPAIGVHVRDVSEFSIEDCQIVGCDVGLKLNGATAGVLSSIEFSDNKVGIEMTNSGDLTGFLYVAVNSIWMQHLNIWDCETAAIKVTQNVAQLVSIRDSWVEYTPTVFLFSNPSDSHTFVEDWIIDGVTYANGSGSPHEDGRFMRGVADNSTTYGLVVRRVSILDCRAVTTQTVGSDYHVEFLNGLNTYGGTCFRDVTLERGHWRGAAVSVLYSDIPAFVRVNDSPDIDTIPAMASGLVGTGLESPIINLMPYSEPTLAQATTKSGTVTQGAGLGGGLSLGITFPATAQLDNAYEVPATYRAGALYTMSVFVKMADSSVPRPSSLSTGGSYDMGLVCGASTARIGNIMAAYTVEPTAIANVYRISAQWIPATSGTGNCGVVRYAGFSGKGFTVTGLQLVEGPTAGPYIPTWGAAWVGGTGVRAALQADAAGSAPTKAEFDALIDKLVAAGLMNAT